MIAMTTSSSMSVNADRRREWRDCIEAVLLVSAAELSQQESPLPEVSLVPSHFEMPAREAPFACPRCPPTLATSPSSAPSRAVLPARLLTSQLPLDRPRSDALTGVTHSAHACFARCNPATSWTAVAARSGDTALASCGAERVLLESGSPLRGTGKRRGAPLPAAGQDTLGLRAHGSFLGRNPLEESRLPPRRLCRYLPLGK